MKRSNQFIYMKIYEQIKQQIMSGAIQPGQFLLPESQLCEAYQASRNSIRRALEQLQAEGLVEKKVGLGTFVPKQLTLEAKPTLKILAPSPAHFVEQGFSLLIDYFKQKNPNVNVQLLRLPISHYWESFLESREMGVTPDIVLLSDLQFTNHFEHEVLADLSQYQNILDERSMPGRLLDPFWTHDEKKLSAIPLTYTPVFLACNPTLFHQQQIPIPTHQWSLEEFQQTVEQLTLKENGFIKQYGFTFLPKTSRWPVFALQRGLKSNQHFTEQQIYIEQALTWLQDLFFRQRFAVYYTEPHPEANPFVHNKAAMILTNLFEMSSWGLQNNNLQAIPMPFGENKSTLLQSNALAIPNENAHNPLAQAFLESALELKAQTNLAQNSPFLSIYQQVNEQTKGSDYAKRLQIDLQQIDNATYLSSIFPTSFINEKQREIELFWLGLRSVEDVMEVFGK